MWEDLGGFSLDFKGPHAVLDFANRAHKIGKRVVYTPFAKYVCPFEYKNNFWWGGDAGSYCKKWDHMLSQGEPFYNKNLILDGVDMGLNCLDWEDSDGC